MFRQFLAAINQYERACIVAKLRGARERKKRDTGRCEGVKPYGTLPGEARWLDVMKDKRANGETFDKIAAWANAEGAKTRYGKTWWGTTVRKILEEK
jgi:hypothetical protein